LFLAEAYNFSYEQVMKMPCSRRHKQVKFRQEVVRQRNAKNGTGGGGSPGMNQTWYQAYQASKQGGSD
jgi:hypothetical protein